MPDAEQPPAVGQTSGGEVQRPTPDRGAFSARQILVLCLAVLVLNFTLGTLLQWWSLVPGLLASQILFVLGPSAVLLFWRKRQSPAFDLGAAASLRRTRLLPFVAALLFFFPLTVLLNWLAWAVLQLVPIPTAIAELLEQMVGELLQVDSPGGLALTVLAVAVVPAVAEELLFRGILLGALQRHLRPAAALALSALLFAAYHLNPWQFLPLFALGLFLGWTVQRTGSLLPAIAGHLVNNGVAIALENLPEAQKERAVSPDQLPPWVLLSVAGLLLFFGAAFVIYTGKSLGRPVEDRMAEPR